ncbi:MAG: DUF3617 family protein [Terracidiphilus sp.]
MLKKGMLAAGILAAISICAIAGQAPDAGTSFGVKEGLWDFTLTMHAISQLPPETLAPYTPAQREQILASLKAAQAKGTVKTQSMCLTRAQLDNVSFMDNQTNCTHQTATEGGAVVRHSTCGTTTIDSRYERVSPESFKGYQNADMHDANGQHLNIDVAAKWAGADCGEINKERTYQAGVAVGVDKDVMTFLPYVRPNGDGTYNLHNFGPHFVYTYTTGDNWPTVGYEGGIPGAPKMQVPDVWFGGTDGNYIYVTIPDGGSICGPDIITLRLDHAGNATRIDKMPSKLHGGRGPNCG